MKKTRPPYASLWLPLLVGLALIPVPLLGNFHIESALLAALVGCFCAALKGCRPLLQQQTNSGRILFILQILYLAGLPLFLYAVFTDCFSWSGLGFWILYPIPSVLFGYAFGRMMRLFHIPFRKTIVVLILIFIAIGIPLIQFFNLPQVYFFNHIWGGWPGPIYDETIQVSWPLLFFRLMTLAWAALFWFLPVFSKSFKAKIVVGFCVGGLTLGYIFLPQLGIVSPRNYIQKALGGVKETPHFVIYYEKSGYTKDEISLIGLEHEFYFEQISETLQISYPYSKHRIESYLYANVRQKNSLTGAKFTSYVPVWLEQDQLHIAKQQLESLKHELVHIIAKQFGNDVLNASWSIGLVEGLAVALAPEISSRTTIHQIVAAEKPWPDAAEMKNALSLTGFYGGRSTVNYTTTGSFVKYLLKHYPIQYFKQVYRTADIEDAYPQSFNNLIEEWHELLSDVKIDSLDQKIAARLFSIPSLFEQACPHVLSPVAQHLQKTRYFLINEDTAAALHQITALRRIVPKDSLLKNRWIFLSLKTGKTGRVLKINEQKIKALSTKLLYADALALKGKWNAAQAVIANVEMNSDSLTYSLHQALKIRKNEQQWRYYLKLVYQGQLLNPDVFQRLYYEIQLLSIGEAIEQERWQLLKRYASIAVNHSLNKHYFDEYLQIVHFLGFRRQINQAERWIERVSHLNLQKRYKQRLKQEIGWINFVKYWFFDKEKVRKKLISAERILLKNIFSFFKLLIKIFLL